MNQKLQKNRLFLKALGLSVITLLFTLFCFDIGYAKTYPNKSINLADITIKGKVSDAETGDGLPGVSVTAKGSSKGAITDGNGDYTIDVPNNKAVLVFSYVGYTQQEVNVGGQTQINIQLKSDSKTLSEVVVVGYGTAKKTDITGAVKSVRSEDFNKGIINSPEQLLQGKVAGVNVTSASGEPGSAQNVSIRGPGGVRTGSTPLFVVDGLALDNSGTGGAMNPLTFLNPQDIETIDVLKDASAT
eukprot:gene7568-10221_t